ncbi:MAG: hypothetical protein U9O24_03005 [Campylobacterota bacterium]|nr:hypothetical protein [Campylobacterota bacterium]
MNKTQDLTYNVHPDIIQSFVDIQERYTSLYTNQTDYPTVKAWLKQIRTEGFNNNMMNEILQYIYKLLQKNQKEEATLLLLVSAATEDDKANYILARELFKGELFELNEAAAFGIFTTLSNKGDAQALCDIALFYKNGIVVEQNKKHACKLYKEAMEAGIERAEKPYLLLSQKRFGL